MTAPLDRRRLSCLLGMLGSSFDPEALAAGRAAEAMRARAGITWHELLGAESDENPHDLIIRCLDHPEQLTDWEISFLHNLRGFSAPSARQLEILEQIALKVGAR